MLVYTYVLFYPDISSFRDLKNSSGRDSKIVRDFASSDICVSLGLSQTMYYAPACEKDGKTLLRGEGSIACEKDVKTLLGGEGSSACEKDVKTSSQGRGWGSE